MPSDLLSACPLCGTAPIGIIQGKYGIHCEGLVCQSCGVNARNRFYYFGLKKVVERLTGVCSKGLAVQGGDQAPHQLKMLEASSFGFAKLGNRYIHGMSQYGTLTCSDYFEKNFKGVRRIDLCDMPFEDQALDIIAHSHVLEHIGNDQKAIQESYRCLSDQGALVFAIPVQTDFTFKPFDPEYHGDNALVYRRNGWDVITKLKAAGFRVEVYVPPEHLAFWQSEPDPTILAIDNIMVGQKFGIQFAKYKELFSPLCQPEDSRNHEFANIWGQLELFVCRRNI
jgi:SAM-dependent methyltransferase